MEPITTPVQEITIDSGKIIHDTEVDFITRTLPNVISLVQYDDSLPVIAVALKENGADYEIPAGAACNIRITKTDDTTIYSPALGCDSTRKIAYFEVTEDMTDAVGELETTIEVIVSGDVAGTSPLDILIERNPVSLSDVTILRSMPVMTRSADPETITTAVEEVTIDSDRILHHTEADLVLRNVPKVIKLVQYDYDLPVIAVDLKSEGINYVLPEGAACNIRIKKPDGTVVYDPAYGCDTTRSVVYFVVTQQMTVLAGELDTRIEVVVSADVAGTSPIRIMVDKNPIQDGDIDSEDETETIIALVEEATEARDDAVSAAGSSEDSADEAEAWATGKIGGTDVPSTADQYHNNAKYYSEQASGSATSASGSASAAATSEDNAEAWAAGTKDGTAVQPTDPQYHNNAAYYAGLAHDDATSASGSAMTATNQALKSEGFAVGKQNGTDVASGSDYYHNNAKYFKEQAEAAAAMLDAEKILGNFATYQATTTASKAYAVGEYLTYNGYLYKVTTAIAVGGTITPNTNCIRTSVGAEIETIFGSITTYEPNASNLSKGYKVGEYCIANGKLYRFTQRVFPGDAIVAGTYTSSDNAVETTLNKELSTDKLWYYHVPVEATTGQIVDIIDSRITPQHVLAEITWADESKITSLTQWTTNFEGHFSIGGSASAATECTVLLVRANVIEDWSE